MTITIPRSEPKEQLTPGTYIARCIGMIHIGTVEYDWQGQKAQSNKVRITFELPTETKVFKEGDEPKPFVISAEYSLSFGKKAKLRPILEAWRGKAFTEEEMDNFDVSKLVGVPAFISILENEKGYSEIATISKLPKGTECPPQINPSQVLDYENWNQDLFDKLPDFIKNKMITTPEYQAMKGIGEKPKYPTEPDPNSVPF